VIENETLGDTEATNNLSHDTARPEELYRTLGWTYLFFATSVREPGCRPSCHNCFHIATDFTFLLAKILLLRCNEMKFAQRWIPLIKSQLM